MEYVILTGSWSELVYREAKFLPGFSPNIRTMDVDFLVRNPRRPSPAAQLTSLAKEKGFYVEVDRMTGVTKLLDITGLEVEFLIGKMGAGVESSLKTNVGATAQALRHMECEQGYAPCSGRSLLTKPRGLSISQRKQP